MGTPVTVNMGDATRWPYTPKIDGNNYSGSTRTGTIIDSDCSEFSLGSVVNVTNMGPFDSFDKYSETGDPLPAVTAQASVVRTGTKAIQIDYAEDEQGATFIVDLPTPSRCLYIRKYERFNSAWLGNWPAGGIKTGRYFSTADRSTGSNLDSGTDDTSTNAAFLTDSTKSWTVNAYVGYYIRNNTDGSYGLITANTATTITATLTGGTDNDWDSGDSYIICDRDTYISEKMVYTRGISGDFCNETYGLEANHAALGQDLIFPYSCYLSGAAVDNGDGTVTLPHQTMEQAYTVGETVKVINTTNYNASYTVLSSTTSSVTVTATYNAETFTGDDMVGYAMSDGNIGIRDGVWYKTEMWAIMNSDVEVADGTLKFWVDDNLVYSNTSAKHKTTSNGFTNGKYWYSFWYGGNLSRGVGFHGDLDGLAAGNSSAGTTLILDGAQTSGGTFTATDGRDYGVIITDLGGHDQTGATYTVNGTDINDNPASHNFAGPAANSSVRNTFTLNEYKTITSITIASPVAGSTVDAGLIRECHEHTTTMVRYIDDFYASTTLDRV